MFITHNIEILNSQEMSYQEKTLIALILCMPFSRYSYDYLCKLKTESFTLIRCYLINFLITVVEIQLTSFYRF